MLRLSLLLIVFSLHLAMLPAFAINNNIDFRYISSSDLHSYIPGSDLKPSYISSGNPDPKLAPPVIDLTVQPADGFAFDHWGYSEGTETWSAAHWKHSFPSDGKVIAYFRQVSGAMAVYPNPASHDLTIGVDAPSAGQADVRITDMGGRELARFTPDVSTGVNGVTIDIGTLSAGMYVITSEVNGDRRIARFVKQ